jgi:hypothetical protein
MSEKEKTKRTRKAAPPPIPYTADHYKIMRMASAAGFPWLGNAPGVHPTIEQVERYGAFAKLVVEEHEANKPKVLSPFVSRDELIAAIKSATRKKEVCTPDDCWGSRQGDWRRDDIEYVDADGLLHALNNPESE